MPVAISCKTSEHRKAIDAESVAQQMVQHEELEEYVDDVQNLCEQV